MIRTIPPVTELSGPVMAGCSALATSRMKTRSYRVNCPTSRLPKMRSAMSSAIYMASARRTSSNQATVGTSADGRARSVRLPGLHEDQSRRPQQHDPQRWKDAADHRQHHLQRGLSSLLLRALAPLAPHVIRLD